MKMRPDMMRGSAVQRGAVFLLLVFLAFVVAGNVQAQESLRGYVMTLVSDGVFRLSDGSVVKLIPSTRVIWGNRVYAGDLLVGLEVRVRGRRSEVSGVLTAEELKVLTSTKTDVKGSAIIEAVQYDGDGGVQVWGDGRTLRVPRPVYLLPQDAEQLEKEPDGEVSGNPSIRPGMFIQYAGHWTENGVVEVQEGKFRLNGLDEKEAALYREFAATIIFPEEKEEAKTYLSIGESRFLLLQDNRAQRYLHNLGRRLLPQHLQKAGEAKAFGLAISFHVVADSKPFALAFPGGVVVVSTAMFQVAETEAQMAFVLGHEIAHVVQEHAWQEKKFHRNKLLFLRWATAGVGYIAESAIRKGYSRSLEEQADRWAVDSLVRVGLDAREVFRFLEVMELERKGLPGLLWESHASYGQRREKIMELLWHLSQRGLFYSKLISNSADYGVVRARIYSSH